ncbi:hypothetical protein FSARC_14648 [Fusarium sarcochroum]|uniref:Cytochrome P450 monooxygenase n=1 Tax=Fusarium sarcochroum TaxID=1208366 RepID=A0A8H4SRQ3_9HYPO|nr:hypothetical protein FSARC_14648 [Fusarium sarcochroum]
MASILQLTGLSIILASLYVVSKVLHSLFFHPLRSYPGPILNRISILPFLYWLSSGTLPYHVADLHGRYGRVIRIAPNELAFCDPRAWRDIYSRQGAGRLECPHDMDYYNGTRQSQASIIACEREEHDAIRKKMNIGFSDHALKTQEPEIQRYIDLLVQRLTTHSSNGQSVNLRDWIAYTTFDLIGKLTFGSDFGCLESNAYHSWIRLIIGHVKGLATLFAMSRLGILTTVSSLMTKLGIGNDKRQLHLQLTEEKTKQRLALKASHLGFLDGLVDSDIPFEQLKRNAALLIVAGSETTATLLTGALFLVGTHPEVYEKLQTEVRSRFTSASDINFKSVNELQYMLAVLNETLRHYPPVAVNSPRRVDQPETKIAGYDVPVGTTVGVWQWALYHDPALFADPHCFDPDRFYDRSNSKYANDCLSAVKPFLIGPRNCLGQNLAILEMRAILARLIWEFDIKISEESRGWLKNQPNFLLWDKPDLHVYLTRVQ